jgi:hypothetical protein
LQRLTSGVERFDGSEAAEVNRRYMPISLIAATVKHCPDQGSKSYSITISSGKDGRENDGD